MKLASCLDKVSARDWSWQCLSSNLLVERRARSVIAERRIVSGMNKMCCWILGAARHIPMTWVTRARVIPSRRAMSA